MEKKAKSYAFRSSGKISSLTKLIVALIFAALVIFPLIRMFLFIDGQSLSKVFSGPTFLTSLKNSLLVALTATAITIVIAYFLALCIERSRVKFKGIFSIILILPMLIPSISHGMGLVVLLGNNGVLTRLFHLDFNIYGFGGIVAGSVMYAFPVAFLMIKDVLRYENKAVYEAADILGIPKYRQFFSIGLPYLRKPLISVVFAVFTLIVTDYGVPLMVGGKFSTIPVIMYQEVIGQLDFGRGAVYGVVLLIPAVIAFIFDLINKDKANSAFVIQKFEGSKNKLVNGASYIFLIAMSLCVLLPIISFIILGFAQSYPSDMMFTLENITKTLDMNAGQYLLNSVVIALAVSAIGVTLSFITAYFTARMKTASTRLLHLIAITSAAVPGIVLGLSYVIVFKGSAVYGTLAILIMVNIIHFIASPYIMVYNSFNKINGNLEAVGKTLGIGRLRLIKDVLLPQSLSTLFEMAGYFFVNSMITISAVSFLANTDTKPVALMINQFEAQSQLECAAMVSLAILLVNILFKAIVAFFKKKLSYK